MSEKDNYHTDTKRVSKSGLDLIAKAPALYYEKYLNPTGKKEATPAMIVGQAFHECTLEPHLFNQNYVIMPEFKGTGSKKAKAEWLEAVGDKIPLSEDNYNKVLGMAASVRKHPIIGPLLQEGEAEKTFEWTDFRTGVKCKCRVDWLNKDGWIIDLKSTTDASDKSVMFDGRKRRFYVQDAFYTDGVESNDVDVQGFVFVSVEKEPPFLVNAFSYNEDSVEQGRDEYHNDLLMYSKCIESGKWPGYDEFVTEMGIPGLT